MIKDIKWVEAKLDDVKIANLVARLPKVDKNLALGGCCGCACGDSAAREKIQSADVRKD
jgi:hypothetical protein